MTDRFPSRMFRWAAIYGVIVLAPLYFTPLPAFGPEAFIGFVGTALVFQGVFWRIGSDPQRYRALMPLGVAEKLVFSVPALAFWAQGRTANPVAGFAVVDILLGGGFAYAWIRLRSVPA
jgi:hypothetical protein